MFIAALQSASQELDPTLTPGPHAFIPSLLPEVWGYCYSDGKHLISWDASLLSAAGITHGNLSGF